MNLHTHTRLRHNMGYVTRSQFRQCLSYLGLGASEEERKVVEMRFSDSIGSGSGVSCRFLVSNYRPSAFYEYHIPHEYALVSTDMQEH